VTATRQKQKNESQWNGGTVRKSAVVVFVAIHFMVLAAHGSLHSQLHIAVGTWQKLFIAIVIFVVPLIATVMLWTGLREAEVILLGFSMAGSLVFGVIYHFVVGGPDNVLGPYHSHCNSIFRATAVLLALIEAAGLALCVLVPWAEPTGRATSDARARPRSAQENHAIAPDTEHPCS
jgi:hypothetical protein